jgi:hypothetical protein
MSFSLTVLPVSTINGAPSGGRTNRNDAVLTITGAGVVDYQYSLDNGPFSAWIPNATQILLSGLSEGLHTVAVLGRDGIGNQQPVGSPTIASWTVKTLPPVLTVNPVSSLIGTSTLTIGGTVELGSVPSVSVDTAATVGTVRTVPGTGISTWSCDISGLPGGVNTLTVNVFDFVFNQTSAQQVVTRILPDGNFKGSGVVDITDCLKALRFVVGLDQPSIADLLHGDIAPFVNGLPTRNNMIDIADALLILRKTVGLVTF